MSAKVFSREDGLSILRDRLKSGEWWVVLGASEGSHTIANLIEQNFYTEGNNDKFEVMMGDFGRLPIVFYFANKSEMSKKRLEELLQIEAPEGKDVIFSPDTPMDVLQWFVNWYDKETT